MEAAALGGTGLVDTWQRRSRGQLPPREGGRGLEDEQAEGWRLDQAELGVLIWHTPAGRTYATRPTQCPA